MFLAPKNILFRAIYVNPALRAAFEFHCDDAVCGGQKMEKEVGVFERSEFHPLPIFCLPQTGTPQGQRRRGRLSLRTFFGEAKKVSGRRATPGKSPRRKTGISEETKAF
ncbi:hypothetical protein [Herminiimonas contaminans]|uniref:Uncharacterized protein n=1 Tax=Herminiimonas contaminans TaxID=1111140 RepID=A0ABS0EY73_9BURK|nr:hypothetical protein [Herminiimonas contaminans]MBF8178093.1 hypothetical protein [Herminiimonas contaminans]